MSNLSDVLVERSKEEYMAMPMYFVEQYQTIVIGPVLLTGGQWGTYIENFGWFESSVIEEVTQKYFEYCRWIQANATPVTTPSV